MRCFDEKPTILMGLCKYYFFSSLTPPLANHTPVPSLLPPAEIPVGRRLPERLRDGQGRVLPPDEVEARPTQARQEALLEEEGERWVVAGEGARSPPPCAHHNPFSRVPCPTRYPVCLCIRLGPFLCWWWCACDLTRAAQVTHLGEHAAAVFCL